VLKDQMDRSREKHAAVAISATQKCSTKANAKHKKRTGNNGRRASGRGKRTRLDSDDEDDEENGADEPLKRAKVVPDEAKPAFVQPVLVTGATLKDYQLEGVACRARGRCG
jgi:ATP-dependent DNA helicase